jgi:hypothetical protein
MPGAENAEAQILPAINSSQRFINKWRSTGQFCEDPSALIMSKNPSMLGCPPS